MAIGGSKWKKDRFPIAHEIRYEAQKMGVSLDDIRKAKKSSCDQCEAIEKKLKHFNNYALI